MAPALQRQLIGQFVGEADSLQFAGRPFRNLVDDQQLFRHLEIGQPGSRKLHELALLRRGPLLQDDGGRDSSPSVGCGTAKATACATAGCSQRTSSTSFGAIFSPPRLMISLRRPVRYR